MRMTEGHCPFLAVAVSEPLFGRRSLHTRVFPVRPSASQAEPAFGSAFGLTQTLGHTGDSRKQASPVSKRTHLGHKVLVGMQL